MLPAVEPAVSGSSGCPRNELANTVVVTVITLGMSAIETVVPSVTERLGVLVTDEAEAVDVIVSTQSN